MLSCVSVTSTVAGGFNSLFGITLVKRVWSMKIIVGTIEIVSTKYNRNDSTKKKSSIICEKKDSARIDKCLKDVRTLLEKQVLFMLFLNHPP